MTVRRVFASGRGVLAALIVGVLAAGCSISDSLRDATRVDYKSASRGPGLDVPPDLVTPRSDDRFAIPSRPSTGTTYSEYAQRSTERPAVTGPSVLPASPVARIERQGNQRWLVVDLPAEKVWPVVRTFWTESGFALRVDSPETGILETDWAERRPNVGDSYLRTQLARVLGSLYSTGERDKFRTRLDGDGKPVTEVYVTHRGLVEEFTGPLKDTTVWVQRPSDPELEVEFLRRLMLRFMPAEQQAAQASAPGAAVSAVPDRARAIEVDGRPYVQMQDPFDRAWRQVGLALDRSGFTVEDRDRSKGTFFVRYVDPDQELKAVGLFNRVFGTTPSKDLSGKRYQIVVADAAGGGSRVGVLDESGAPPSTDVDKRIATRIVELLRDQLR